MQQEKNLQKQQDLETLEQLIEQAGSGKNISEEQLHQLFIKYPNHAVQLVKKYMALRLQPAGSPLTKAYLFALCLDKMYHRKLQRFLVNPPADKLREKEFNRAIEVFEDQLLRQTTDN
ncbi:hypothetical protein OCK74_12365 [Chitinophagaceae bacterium LB-8]|uniref:Uncharacterized protein n=1 Tax=Paraflavisolibacter caeni TaxID=2982496 RepID=A0A9X2XWP8_9BACT|nr:hypothetical protein [Paraflavisolibacter caeni]MCU7549917.1 hypothetical protein [Paraflavisolibacter caeni]